jgi:hypothetical protein
VGDVDSRSRLIRARLEVCYRSGEHDLGEFRVGADERVGWPAIRR